MSDGDARMLLNPAEINDLLTGEDVSQWLREEHALAYAAAMRILQAFSRERADEVPYQAVRSGQNVLQALVAATRHVRQSRSEKTLEDLNTAIEQAHRVATNDLRPHVRGGSVDWVNEAAAAREARQRAEEIEAQIALAREQLDALDYKAREIIEKVGVGSLAGHYNDEAMTHQKAARNWLYGVLVCAALLLSVVGWLLGETHQVDAETTLASVVAMAVSKALAIGVLSYAVTFCSKNYRTNRHLNAAYRQKAASLETYAAMAISLREDPQDRHVVLSELAKAVFAATDTGLTQSGTGDKTVIENSIPLVSAIRGT